MRYKIIIILLLMVNFSFSINISKKDSIENLLINANEKRKIHISSQLADMYMSISLDKAKEYVLMSLKFAEKFKDTVSIASCYRQFGAIKLFKEERDSAIIYFYKSLELLKKTGNIHSINSTKANIAAVYYQEKEYDKTLNLLLDVLNDFIKLGAEKEQAVIYNNIGKVYQEKKEYKKAIEYFFNSIKLKDKKNDELSIAYTLSNIGQTYSSLKKDDLASKYLLKALDILNYYDDEYSIAITSLYLGEHYLSTSNYEKSDIYLQQSVNISKSNNYNNILKNNYLLLSELHEASNNLKQALKYRKLFESIKDTVHSKEKERILIEFQTKYDIYEKNTEIKRLNEDNALNLEKLITRTRLLNIFIVAFIFVSILILIIFFQKRRLSKAYNHLLQQNLNVVNVEGKLTKLKSEIGHINISKETEGEIYTNLLNLIEKDKVFTNTNLTLSFLAEKLNTNTSYLSKIINDEFNLNFNNFINSYRIKEARILLSNPENYNYTIASISNKVGFKSISVFNKAFKDNTGLTPSFFMKNAKKEQQ